MRTSCYQFGMWWGMGMVSPAAFKKWLERQRKGRKGTELSQKARSQPWLAPKCDYDDNTHPIIVLGDTARNILISALGYVEDEFSKIFNKSKREIPWKGIFACQFSWVTASTLGILFNWYISNSLRSSRPLFACTWMTLSQRKGFRDTYDMKAGGDRWWEGNRWWTLRSFKYAFPRSLFAKEISMENLRFHPVYGFIIFWWNLEMHGNFLFMSQLMSQLITTSIRGVTGMSQWVINVQKKGAGVCKTFHRSESGYIRATIFKGHNSAWRQGNFSMRNLKPKDVDNLMPLPLRAPPTWKAFLSLSKEGTGGLCSGLQKLNIKMVWKI